MSAVAARQCDASSGRVRVRVRGVVRLPPKLANVRVVRRRVREKVRDKGDAVEKHDDLVDDQAPTWMMMQMACIISWMPIHRGALHGIHTRFRRSGSSAMTSLINVCTSVKKSLIAVSNSAPVSWRPSPRS